MKEKEKDGVEKESRTEAWDRKKKEWKIWGKKDKIKKNKKWKEIKNWKKQSNFWIIGIGGLKFGLYE